MNSYTEAILLLDNHCLEKLNNALDRWRVSRIGRIVVPNITQLERFLPPELLVDLLTALSDSSEKPVNEIQESYQNQCYRNLTIQGGKASISPSVGGKVVERDKFVDWLWKNYSPLFPSVDDAEHFVSELLSDPEYSLEGSDDKRNIKFGSNFAVWVTWNENDLNADPFYFIQHNCADEARACLGLEPSWDNKLLVFTYNLPEDLELFRPTIADAGLFTFFRPPPIGNDSYGLTMPWEPTFLLISPRLNPDYDPIPRPEAIHRAGDVTLSSLKKIKELI